MIFLSTVESLPLSCVKNVIKKKQGAITNTSTIQTLTACAVGVQSLTFEHISHCRQRIHVSMWCATSDAHRVRSERTPHLRNLSPLLKLTHSHRRTNTRKTYDTHTHTHRVTKRANKQTDRQGSCRSHGVRLCVKRTAKLLIWQLVCSEREREKEKEMESFASAGC